MSREPPRGERFPNAADKAAAEPAPTCPPVREGNEADATRVSLLDQLPRARAIAGEKQGWRSRIKSDRDYIACKSALACRAINSQVNRANITCIIRGAVRRRGGFIGGSLLTISEPRYLRPLSRSRVCLSPSVDESLMVGEGASHERRGSPSTMGISR